MKTISVGSVALVLFFVISPRLMAMGRKPGLPASAPRFSAWAAYWDKAKARQALFTEAARLEEVDLFAFHFAENDTLVPALASFKEMSSAFTQLPGKKPRLAITVVNDIQSGTGMKLKDPAVVHRVISTPAAREAHIQQIMDIAEGAQSIDIDYERVAPEDSEAFSAFIQALATSLHQKGKRLSVVLEPRVSDELESDPLRKASHALSWAELAQSADQVTVMAYLYHYGGSGPGSLAPIDWVQEIAAYGQNAIPPEKFSVALHLGGYDWPKDRPGVALDYDKAEALATVYGTAIQLDRDTQSGHFSYNDGLLSHEVWIETAAGLQQKVQALQSMGIRHMAFWRLGAGDPAFWKALPKRPD